MTSPLSTKNAGTVPVQNYFFPSKFVNDICLRYKVLDKLNLPEVCLDGHQTSPSLSLFVTFFVTLFGVAFSWGSHHHRSPSVKEKKGLTYLIKLQW